MSLMGRLKVLLARWKKLTTSNRGQADSVNFGRATPVELEYTVQKQN